MKLHIDLSWTFNDFINNLEALTFQYREVVASFSYKQIREETLFIRQTRNTIYSFNFEEWKKDRIWEVLNNDFDIEELKKIAIYTN